MNQVDVYSGYGFPNVATGTVPGPAATVDQLRLTITDPSGTTPDVARVYEVAAH